eukprot:SAG22_NODE_1452_length_4395_cov_2.925745_8_plen_110_part_00
MEIFQIKTLRKAIRQNNFDKKVFLGFVTENNIDEAIHLILEKGFVPEGGTDLKAAIIFNGLKNLAENDFTMFVRAFQILFKFAGSLAFGSGSLFSFDIQPCARTEMAVK